jgi:hypothetical protein
MRKVGIVVATKAMMIRFKKISSHGLELSSVITPGSLSCATLAIAMDLLLGLPGAHRIINHQRWDLDPGIPFDPFARRARLDVILSRPN